MVDNKVVAPTNNSWLFVALISILLYENLLESSDDGGYFGDDSDSDCFRAESTFLASCMWECL